MTDLEEQRIKTAAAKAKLKELALYQLEHIKCSILQGRTEKELLGQIRRMKRAWTR